MLAEPRSLGQGWLEVISQHRHGHLRPKGRGPGGPAWGRVVDIGQPDAAVTIALAPIGQKRTLAATAVPHDDTIVGGVA